MTEEAKKPVSGRSTIVERKKIAGWITNDIRKQLVSKGKLRPGNKHGQKCLCCISFSDRCKLHDFPTGVNSYCCSFTAKETEEARHV